MPLTASSMASKIKTYVEVVIRASGPVDVSRQDAVLNAMCQGIIDEITKNGIVTTSDAQGGTNTGTIS